MGGEAPADIEIIGAQTHELPGRFLNREKGGRNHDQSAREAQFSARTDSRRNPRILNEVEHDRDVRAVILLGSEKAFCTGIDTSEFQIEENGYLISTGSARGPGR